MNWVPDSHFFNKGHATFEVKKDETEEIKWKFKRYSGKGFPFFYHECEITGWGIHTSGFAVSTRHDDSIRKSFGEAWERLWMLKVGGERSVEQVQDFSSNGFAAGSSDEHAILASRNELIERVVLLTAWRSKSGWSRNTKMSPRSRLLCFALKLKGWSVNLFDLKSNIGTVKACLAIHKRYGAIFDTSFSDNEVQSEKKVIDSVAKNTFFAKELNFFDLPHIGFPEDHLKFYSVVENIKAFDFLLHEPLSNATIEISKFDSLETHLIVPAGMFPAVALSINPRWPKLVWGKNSISGLNSWPHPLA